MTGKQHSPQNAIAGADAPDNRVMSAVVAPTRIGL
jgi:hypothetical protein